MHKIPSPPAGQYFFKWELNNVAYVQFKASHSKSLRWQQTPWVLLHAASIHLSLSLNNYLLCWILITRSALSTGNFHKQRERERERDRLMPDDEMRGFWKSVVFQQHSVFDDYNGRSLTYIPRKAERRCQGCFNVSYIFIRRSTFVQIFWTSSYSYNKTNEMH